jgi:predicted ATPase
MRITSVSACGLLTFENFRLDLDKRLTLIVGPNGSGKSNFGRLFEIVSRVIQSADRDSSGLQETLKRYLVSRRVELDEHGIEIRLTYQLTENFERELLASFVRACTVAALLDKNYGFDTSEIEDWADTITQDQLECLYRGEIVVHHGGTPDAQWECWIEFEIAGVLYLWGMLGTRRDSIVQTKDHSRTDLPGVNLANRLRAGLEPSASSAHTPPAQDFNFSILLPNSDSTVSCALDLGRQPVPRAFQGLAEQIGVNPIGSASDRINYYGLAHIFSIILRRSFIQTNDTRLLPSWTSRSTTVEVNSGENVLRTLFALKNGRSTEVETFRKIQALFSDFTHGRKMELAILPMDAEIGIVPTEGAISILPIVLVSVSALSSTEQQKPHQQVPIEFAGAGAWEALVLSYILGSRLSSFIVLDEPAVALHPNLQRRLTTHLQSIDAQIVVITHSPYLFPLDGDRSTTRVIRFDRGNHSDTIPAVASDSRMAKIAPKLRRLGNERIAFASSVVLAEGKIDQAAIQALADQTNLDLDGHNVAIIDCDGRDNIPDYVRFCTDLRLRFLAIQDGDAGKPDAASGVQAVREAVSESSIGTLFEFPEDIESTLGGVKKDVQTVCEAMRAAAIQSEIPAEVAKLREMLSDLLEPQQNLIHLPTK